MRVLQSAPERKRALVAMVLLALVLAALLSACGGSSSSSSSESTSQASESGSGSAETTASSEGPESGGGTGTGGRLLKVGVIASESGAGEQFVAPNLGALAAWQKSLESKPIKGYEVEVIIKDDKSETAAGLAAAKELVEQDHVAAMLIFDGSNEEAIEPYLKSTKTPLLGVGYNLKVYGGESPNVFGTATNVGTSGNGLMMSAKELGATNFGGLVCSEAPVCKEAVPLYEAQAKEEGLEFGGLLTASASAPDYTAPCLSLIEHNVDALFLGMSTQESGVRASEECVKQGYSGAFLAANGTFEVPAWKSLEGSEIAGPINGFPWWAKDPKVEEYVAAMKESGNEGVYQSPSATATWAALKLLAASTELVKGGTGDVTQEEVTNAYLSFKGESLEGLLPTKMTFSAKGTPAPPCFWLYKYVGGEAEAESLPARGKSGNGASGELQSTCIEG